MEAEYCVLIGGVSVVIERDRPGAAPLFRVAVNDDINGKREMFLDGRTALSLYAALGQQIPRGLGGLVKA